MLRKSGVFLVFLFSISVAFADNVATLYQVKVAVADHSQAKRQQALFLGLKKVLIRVTGDPHLTITGLKKSFTTKPTDYVRRYSYFQDDDNQWFLSVIFDKSAISHKLKEMGQASLGIARPLVLLWLSVAKPTGQQAIINPENTPVITQHIQQLADDYALPIQFPLMDLTDHAQQVEQAVVQQNFTVLTQASRRYRAAAVLMGNLFSINGRWQGDWTLSLGSNQQTWISTAASSAQLIKQLMASVLARVAAHYAVIESEVPADNLPLALVIENVNSMADYANVLTFIKSIDFVQQVAVKSVEQQKMFLTLVLRGRSQDLVEAIKLSQKFVIIPADTDDVHDNDTLMLYLKASSQKETP